MLLVIYLFDPKIVSWVDFEARLERNMKNTSSRHILGSLHLYDRTTHPCLDNMDTANLFAFHPSWSILLSVAEPTQRIRSARCCCPLEKRNYSDLVSSWCPLDAVKSQDTSVPSVQKPWKLHPHKTCLDSLDQSSLLAVATNLQCTETVNTAKPNSSFPRQQGDLTSVFKPQNPQLH